MSLRWKICCIFGVMAWFIVLIGADAMNKINNRLSEVESFVPAVVDPDHTWICTLRDHNTKMTCVLKEN